MTNRPLPKILAAICASCIFFTLFFCGAMCLARLGYVKDANDQWNASLVADAKEIILPYAGMSSVSIHVENLGMETLNSAAQKNPVFISFHIQTQSGRTVKYDNDRFALSEPLRKNQQKAMTVVLDNTKLKLKQGKYIVEFDLVKEGKFWFAEKDGHTLKIPMTVDGETE